jgi:hypothetical protein
MSEIELFAYVMFAIGTAYVLGFGFATYLAMKYGIPVFGMPAPPPLPSPPSTIDKET